MKHTPKPWKVMRDIALELVIARDKEGPGLEAIGEVYRHYRGRRDTECFANAQVVAAAPDLLEVCEAVADAPARARDMMKREKFAFDDLDQPWQKFAFTLYTMLVEAAGDAEAAIAQVRRE